jgi:p24 family protein delta-1
MRRIEEMVQEIVNEMDYLRAREQKLRDTNESTNERVKYFAFGTMGMLVGLGAWQVIYLRAYFRQVFFFFFSSSFSSQAYIVLTDNGPGRSI